MDEKEMRELLIIILQDLNEQRSALYSALAEVAAVRDALIEIGPACADLVARHRTKHATETKPALNEIIREFDSMIERLR